ncbi:MAG: hypothetical protein AB8G26_03530 [Ilumatobacter sp.]
MSDTQAPTHQLLARHRPTRGRRARLVAVSAACAAVAFVVPGASMAGAERDVTAAPAPIEALDIGCQTQTEPGAAQAGAVDGVIYGVACRWTVPTSDQVAGVRLVRAIVGSDQAREVVFRTTDVEENDHVDAPVRPDRRYAYRVQGLNEAGRVVASSRTTVVGVASVDVEPLRLECRTADEAPAADATRVGVGCRWTTPTTARVLTLWRSVDGGARERVASFTHPFPSSYRDVVPATAQRVVYAVIGTASSGVIVARSRAEHVVIPDATAPTRDVVQTRAD